jgi:hypothetical protein
VDLEAEDDDKEVCAFLAPPNAHAHRGTTALLPPGVRIDSLATTTELLQPQATLEAGKRRARDEVRALLGSGRFAPWSVETGEATRSGRGLKGRTAETIGLAVEADDR